MFLEICAFYWNLFLITSPAWAVAKYCDVYVCLSVCLSLREISPEPRGRSLSIFVHVAYGPGLVLLRRRCDTLCTSGFVDDIMFLLCVWQSFIKEFYYYYYFFYRGPYSGMNFATKDRFRLNLLLYRKVGQNSSFLLLKDIILTNYFEITRKLK